MARGNRHERQKVEEAEYRVNLETHPDTERTIAEYSKAVWGKLRRDPLRQTARIVRRQLREWNQHRGQRDVTAGTNAVRVPGMLQPPSLKYAGYAGPWLEEPYLRNYRDFESSGATDLPILWDNCFAQAQAHSYWPQEFARRFRAMWSLLAGLADQGRAFFTVLGIYDFPIWNWHLFPENIVVLAANGYGDVAIPLLKGDRPFRAPAKDIGLALRDVSQRIRCANGCDRSSRGARFFSRVMDGRKPWVGRLCRCALGAWVRPASGCMRR